ncbi:SH3 domain-containing protein [Romboutsia sp.]|uniref:SH3 domain-containing protein n=1 Tax=Romboutsia sp. TaxID=1965302 RepID=UPI003F2DBBA8
MSLKKHINRTLVLGLTISSVCVSTHSVYALNEDVNKEVTKPAKKIELKVDKNEEIISTKKAIVTTSVLNVREEASQESDKVGALVEGMVVTVLEIKEEWTKVQYADNKEGWVNSEFVANEKAKVNTNELNLRKAPSIKEDNIEKLNKNTQLEILTVLEIENKEEETSETWYEVKVIKEKSSEVESNKEKIGFVFGEYVLTESDEAKIEEEARIKAEAEKKEIAQAQQTEQAKTQQTEQVKTQQTVQSDQVVSNTTSNKKEPVKESSSANLAGRTITVNASAYSGHSITATGTVPKWGTIAVDPSVIPYGTKVYIPMFDKVFIAEDCGGAIKGNKIDIFMNSSQETNSFGRRNIEIKILG